MDYSGVDMEGFGPINQMDDYGTFNKVVIYVNPRQYDRMIRRRMERNRFLERRGKPRPMYVPIAVREMSFNISESDNLTFSFQNNKNYVQTNCGNQLNSNPNIYINNNTTKYPYNNNMNGNRMNNYNITNVNINNNCQASGCGNNINYNYQVYSNTYGNYTAYNNACAAMCNSGFGNENIRSYNQSVKTQPDNMSSSTETKYVPINSLSNNRNGVKSYANNSNPYNNQFPIDEYTLTKFEALSSLNSDNSNIYETYMPINTYSSISSTKPQLPNLNNQIINNSYLNNLASVSYDSAASYLSRTMNESQNESQTKYSGSSTNETIKEKENSFINSNTREEIRNNYLRLNNTPFSEYSIDSPFVPRTEQIYNINQNGIILDTGSENGNPIGVRNPLLEGNLIDNIDPNIIESSHENYFGNVTLFETNSEETSNETQLQSILLNQNSINTSSTIVDENERIFNTENNTTTNSINTNLSIHSLECLATNHINPQETIDTANGEGDSNNTYIYGELNDF